MISIRRNCVRMKALRSGIPCCLNAPVPACRLQCLSRCHRVFLAHQKFEPAAGPCKMFAHPAGRISLNHRVYPCGFERALCKLGLWTATKRLYDDQVGVTHEPIIWRNRQGRNPHPSQKRKLPLHSGPLPCGEIHARSTISCLNNEEAICHGNS
jgi:hypothetical protein